MHELSIALEIIELAEEALSRHGGERVKAVYIQVGPLAGVTREALLFSFGIACEGTTVEGSSLLIQEGEGMDLDILRMEIEP